MTLSSNEVTLGALVPDRGDLDGVRDINTVIHQSLSDTVVRSLSLSKEIVDDPSPLKTSGLLVQS